MHGKKLLESYLKETPGSLEIKPPDSDVHTVFADCYPWRMGFDLNEAEPTYYFPKDIVKHFEEIFKVGKLKGAKEKKNLYYAYIAMLTDIDPEGLMIYKKLLKQYRDLSNPIVCIKVKESSGKVVKIDNPALMKAISKIISKYEIIDFDEVAQLKLLLEKAKKVWTHHLFRYLKALKKGDTDAQMYSDTRAAAITDMVVFLANFDLEKESRVCIWDYTTHKNAGRRRLGLDKRVQ